jgi:Cellulase (glycosyl hydrolase family 5)
MMKSPTLLCAVAAIVFLPSIFWGQENVSESQASESSEVRVPDAASPVRASGTARRSAVTGSSGHTIKQSFFGADFNGFGTWPPTDGQHQIATLGSVRLWDDNVKWAQINTASGKYDWSELDTWISKAQAQGVDVLYTFGDTPKWAGSVPKGSPCTAGQGSYSCSAPKDVNSDGTGSDNDFSDFVTALVKRYKGQIAYYELWNEPDCTCFWSGTQAQMVRMGKDAASIIRSTDSKAKILSPSAHGPTMKTWFDGYIAAGGAPNFDIVNAHLRGTNSTNKDPEAFLTMWDDVTTETAKRNLSSLPVWDDEHGIKVGQMSDNDELAGYVARSAILRAGVGVQRQYIYTWDHGQPVGLQGNDSGTAWDVVAGWLIGHTINACVASGNIYTCALDNGQIVWDTSKTCSKGSCSTSSYTFPSTYKYQTDLTGTKKSLSGKTVSIGYKPILLTSK